MVRAGEGSSSFFDFIENKIIAIGWRQLGNLCEYKSREELREGVDKVYSNESKSVRSNFYHQIEKFLFEMKKDDKVITYSSELREYRIGSIVGECDFQPDLIHWLPNTRKVQWEFSVERDKLTASTKNSLGAIQTIFKPSEEAVSEIYSVIHGGDQVELPDTLDESEIYDNLVEQSHEFIKDNIIRLDWKEVQELVAGILRGMGYKTRVSIPRPDRGVDIKASPDGLGLSQPRIFVEVKHRPNEQIGAKDIRVLIGGRNGQQDRCLFVSTGGFSREAKYEADRSNVPLTLIDLDELASLLVENYDSLDIETKTLVPLVKLYWPTK